MKKITKFEIISIVIWVIFSFIFVNNYINIHKDKKEAQEKYCYLLKEISNLKNESFGIDSCLLMY